MIRRITTAAGAAAAVALAGCATDSDEFLGQVGDHILDFAIEASAAEGIPGGPLTIEELALAAVDEARGDDPFGGQTDFFTESASFFSGCPDECPAYEFPTRNGAEDTRLPALQEDDAGFATAITPTDVFGVPLYVISASNLEPATTYFVALARLGTTVNGQLDAVAVRLNNETFGDFQSDPADPPDVLAPLGGSIGVTFGSNPYLFGTFTTTATGTTFSFPAFDGGGDDAYLQTNEPESFELPQYNYAIIYRGDPRVDGVPVARGQFGIDLDMNGDPIVASYAPFPIEPIPTLAELLALDCCAGEAGTIAIELSNLARVTGVYQLWLLNTATGEMVSPTGTLTVLEPDEEGVLQEVETLTGVRSFAGDGDRVFRFETDDDRAGANVGAFTHLFVSLEGSEAGSPGASQPLWGQYTEVDPDDPADAFGFSFINTSSAEFGTFDRGENTDPFDVQGFGRGAFLGDELGHSDMFRARFRNLDRPPVGYEIEGFFIDDQGSDVSTGPLKAPPEEDFAPLTEVDIDPGVSASVSPAMIIEAADRATLADLGQEFYTYERYILSLHPKAAVDRGPTVILGGELPEALRARAPSAPQD